MMKYFFHCSDPFWSEYNRPLIDGSKNNWKYNLRELATVYHYDAVIWPFAWLSLDGVDFVATLPAAVKVSFALWLILSEFFYF